MAIPYPKLAPQFSRLIAEHRAVTLLSHVNPDPDAIGTSLGIYHWVKAQGKRVEVVNASTDIPRHLDFLVGFTNIKHKIDFDDSLIVACDSSSVDRLGFDVAGRTIVNIDHHPTNPHYGTLNVVDPQAVASSEVAFRLLDPLHPFGVDGASAIYAALISDTRNFTTGNMHGGVFGLAETLVNRGIDVAEVTRQMLDRRSLASLRILGVAIDSLELVRDARVSIMSVTQEDLARTGARYSDLDGVVEYGRSLATVQVALLLVERPQQIKVSLRSTGVDVVPIAQHFGGGGHHVAAGFETERMEMDALKEAILNVVDEEGVLS